MALLQTFSSRLGRILALSTFLALCILLVGYQTASPLSIYRQNPVVLKQPESDQNIGQGHQTTGEAGDNMTPPPRETWNHHEGNTGIPANYEDVSPPTTPSGGEDIDEDVGTGTIQAGEECVSFEKLQRMKPGPLSAGKRQFPYVRPPPHCRTFQLPALEKLIERMRTVIRDPDLFRLFENSYPNTLDTMIKWHGYARNSSPWDTNNGGTPKSPASSSATPDEAQDPEEEEEKEEESNPETDEELTYIITGDIDAMWLRDSASQLYSYLPFLTPSPDKNSLASLWRGLINLHARYIVISPYCHSFQPPPESGIPPTRNGAYAQNNPQPPYDPQKVFDCKWELDSLASFLQISSAYHARVPEDLAFFGKYRWIEAVQAAVDAAAAMRLGTYDEDGKVLPSAWTFTGWTNRGSETLTNDGLGNPVKENGMVRSGFRPSDDACIFQLLTPSNMMFAAYLEQASVIMEGLAGLNGLEVGKREMAKNVTVQMRELARGIRHGIAKDAVVTHREFGEMFAYEVDGYGSANLMDDANVPSLLAFPLWNYTTHPLVDPKTIIAKSTHGDSRNHQVPKRSASDQSPSLDDELSPPSPPSSSSSPLPPKPKPYITTPPPSHNYSLINQNTRRFILSLSNPYFATGPALSAVGGPHLGPGKGWPMAATVAALTAYNSELSGLSSGTTEQEKVVSEQLRMILDSTSGTGVVHETVNAWNEKDWTRSWFGWANGLFGELIVKIAEEEAGRGVKWESGEGLLGRLWQ
ncbi:glycoside hydrolase family 125 protein [Neurospora crassa]|uniref:DUF1237 domain-containing protein n=1 Tax=Neurospora crassa (strain ATCC 24698 / 74-OR23-1A / CBS 708.71 / DSM 1257 / FGSC 987) TaxID=367110 RepID=Q7SGP4_NEUCR|nr:hypothetical protein NCU08371 [Neurospora crassa OR74A]EAA36038.1 hypothetical protein NCU08371 [Neurospora crassa OR74A]KHE88493.1 glycoside hydrolase family 125 protein [Neurospora crassa]|eukprot:XP_965274.1 hypothetical protein NCU08371 [Neurospora crassa OR74A]